jgi:hypothetical protein
MSARVVLFFVCLLLPARTALGQELEPRILANVPPGMHFAILAYGYSQGNILLDPAVPIEDLDADLHTFVGGYARTFGLFGRSAQVDVVVPWAAGNWDGLYQGTEREVTRNGLGDPRIRLSWRFSGAPALDSMEDMRAFRQDLIAGASVQIITPYGEYHPSKLINLGSNRWTVRGAVGVSKAIGPWILEGYGGIWVFAKNDNYANSDELFPGGAELEQKPLFTAKIHGIRSFASGRWLSLDVGYGIGGRSLINGVERDTRISAVRFGLTYVWPIDPQHSLKFYALSGVRIEKGPDFDVLGLAYQFRWGGPS